MDADFSRLLLQDGKPLFEFDSASASSDLGYYSACSSLSPASSTDSCCFSPHSFQSGTGPEQEATNRVGFSSPAAQEHRPLLPTQEKKRSRSRYPGKKRESASEREKLRMRDLTKALNHVRTYLPPSVAPAGQTLTKIETLRLTIRYISHLSAQLELGEEAPCRGSPADQPHLLTAPQGSVQTPFQGPGNAVTAERPGVPQPSDQISYMLQSSMYPSDSYILPQTPREDYWTPMQHHDFPGYY